MALWCKLDSLVPLPDAYRVCACCAKRRQHNDKRCLYEFLICLRPEFEPAKVRLLSRRPPSKVIEALNDLRIEEIWLQSMSKKPLSGILAAPAAAHVVPDASRSFQAAQAAPSAVTLFTADVRCNNCGNFGYTYQNCVTRKKNNHRGGHSKRRSSGSSGGTSSSLSQSDVAQLVNLLQRLTHHGSSGPTNFSKSSPGMFGQGDTWDWPL
uniref:CCHC-type domain-containing protein n=1 Tax=Arundo donax TaxID=35708 RepID=A0A0A8YRY0_ARUDO